MHQIQIPRSPDPPEKHPALSGGDGLKHWSSNIRDPDHSLRSDRNCSQCVRADLNTEPYHNTGTSPSPIEATRPGRTPQTERHP
ncbi:hypothetical protein LDENG_00281520, partial [Lucifuga dentata]